MKGFTGVVALFSLMLPWAAASSEVVAFKDGTEMSVQGYELRTDVVVITTLGGKLQLVPRSLVDLETTERLNRFARVAQPVANERPPPTPPADGMRRKDFNPPAPNLESAKMVPSLGSESASRGSLPVLSPPAPAAPEVVARDSEGHITVRATRLTEPIVLDGNLDDPVYSRVKSVRGFVQQEPDEGEPATEETEAWIFFDESNLYVAARCWDTHPERMVVNEMRRDHRNIGQNENITVVLDTFYDRRNGFYFQANALAGLRDQAIGDEGESNNMDWNTVWNAKTSRFDQGWTIEMAFPFKSLRFKDAGPQVWGINVRRAVIWKNERSFIAPIAASHGPRGVSRVSEAATLVGVEVPGSNRNLELKPYAISSLTTDQKAEEPFSNEPDADAGFDAKYGLTSGLIADFTLNTDFAQVEEDEQQINLTRFNLLFPEKREFFLEGQSIFAFGGGSARGFGGGLTPIMFFSRRIGLTEEGEDPIRLGGRVTGRAGKFRIGALNIQTRGVEENPLISATNFSVFRVRRDIFRRSDIGVIATYRNTSLTEGAGSNGVFGFDANFAFYQNLRLNTYYAVSRTTLDVGGATGGDHSSYTGKFDYAGDRYGLVFEHLYVGEGFEPEMGFLRREAFRQNSLQARFSPRPRSIEAIRQFAWEASLDRITDTGGRLETRTASAQFRIEFENADRAWVDFNDNFEFLPEEFEIVDDVTLPVGDYRFRNVRFGYNFGQQRAVPASINYQTGGFYDGNRNALNVNARVEISPKFSVEPRLSLNWVDLPEGSFDTRLASARVTYTFGPRLFVTSFIQYNSRSDSLSASFRFRWEYEPGSDLFVVYSEGREDLASSPFLGNRTLAVKLTKLFRF